MTLLLERDGIKYDFEEGTCKDGETILPITQDMLDTLMWDISRENYSYFRCDMTSYVPLIEDNKIVAWLSACHGVYEVTEHPGNPLILIDNPYVGG